MRSRSLQALALCLVVATLVDCGDRDGRHGNDQNVIVILVDTLRADHLSVAGYPKPTSPRFERLARRGVYFDSFYSHSAITRPSVTTLLTSRYMSGHGVLGHGGYALPTAVPYLPSLLADSGYHTAAFITSPQIHSDLGYSRGFDQFTGLYSSAIDPRRVTPHDLAKIPAAEVFDDVKTALGNHPEKPFFYYVHLLDPHGPYEVEPGDVAPFYEGEYDGNVTGSIQDFARLPFFRSNPAALEYFKALYDAEIAGMDTALGDFVDWLDAEGYLESTHVIVTADHGEELLEHGHLGHSYFIHQELLRIPLLWFGPGIPQGKRVDELAGLVDIVPTLFDVLGLPTPKSAHFAGRSLRPLWQGGKAPGWRTALFVESVERQQNPGSPTTTARAIVTKTQKVVTHGCAVDRPTWGSMEIFDLIADPGEEHGRFINRETSDLTAAERDAVRLYLQELESTLSSGRVPKADQVQLPEEDIEQLRALGYVD